MFFLSVNENEGSFHLQIPRYEGFFKVINVKKKHDKSITPKSNVKCAIKVGGNGKKIILKEKPFSLSLFPQEK